MKTPLFIAALLLPLVLARCAAGPDLSTPQGQCQAQAENSDKVRMLRVQSSGGSPQQQMQALRDLPYARREAYNACLQARGLAPKGGVEPLR